MTMPTRRLFFLLLVLVGAGVSAAAGAQAQTRAWLDRDRIAMGETATLNIETRQAGAQAPDYAPLEADFILSAHSSRQQFQLGAGRTGSSTLYAVALQPRREGVLRIPPLRVGSDSTEALTLAVSPPAPAPTRAGGAVFIETEADHAAPYVQQAVGFVVRLYYATQLISGQLDQPTPEGAALQRVGSDLQYSRDIDGRRYTVVERRYLLIPERSGPLTLPPARFEGRGVGGFFDDIFGDGQRALTALGPRRVLDVRPIPTNAAQPWLPLHAFQMRFVDPPARARAGDAVEVVIEATADGASATQLPDLQLQAGDGAQVFAEPPQVDETFDAGRPRVRITRAFSIVPAREGVLRVRGPRVAWWDVDAATARTTALEDLVITVDAAAPAPAGTRPSPAPATVADAPADTGAWVRVPGVQGEVRPWALATVVFALLWLVTLMWALGRSGAPTVAATAGTPSAVPSSPATSRQLRQALDSGGLGDVLALLCAMAVPTARDGDDLLARLAEPAQRDAVLQLQRARWGDGDPAAARAAVRTAFARGPAWRAPPEPATPLLPPLYPEHSHKA